MLSQFCIRRPIFAAVLSILIVLAGLVSLQVLPVSQYPNITPPSVMVSTSYEGANAQALARTVAAPIENQLSGIEGLIYYTTSIRANGDVRIQCVFDVGTDPNDAMLEINNRVRSAERSLPDAVRQNGVNVRKRSNESLMTVAFTSPDGSMTPTQLADYALLNVVDYLKRLPGIGDVSVFGNTQSAMRIWMDPLRMAKMKVTPEDIDKAVTDKNQERGAGRIGTAPTPADQKLFYTTRTHGQLLTPEQFGGIVLRADENGHIVRLRDVAVTEVGKRSYEFLNVFQGKPSITVGVYLQSGANAMAAAKEVKAELARLEKQYPAGKVEHQITDDTTVFVQASLTEVFKTLIEAGILVLLVVFLFLQNWRATLIPMLAVPVSLIGTMAGLWLFGFSLNTLTLFAMTLSIGIVVDDAIVVLENVERLMTHEGLGPFEAAQKAMREVASALVAIVLVLCAVFVPVAFLGGMAGELYKQFAVTVAVSVAISGFVALTLTPALCAVILKKEEPKKGRFFTAFNKGLSKLTFGYLQCVKWALHWRSIAAVVLIAVTVACWQMIERTPTSFVPSEDQGILRMTMTLPEGASFARTRAESDAMRQKLQAELPSLDTVLVMTGFDTQGGDIRPNAATFIIKLKNWNDRTISADEVLAKLRIIGATSKESVTVASLPAPIRGLGSSSGFSGYIQSRGSDDALMLQRVTEDFLVRLAERPELTGLRHFVRAESPLIQVDLDDVKASQLGITSDNVYSTLTAFFAGSYINNYTRNGRIYRVIMQGEDRYRLTPEDLGKVWVRSDTTGEMVPLSAVLTVKRTSGPESLARMNGYLAAQFMGSAVQGVSSGEAIRIVEETAQEYLPEGYAVEWTGQAWQEKRIGASSTTAFIFGMIIVFLILAALYERWSLPIAVVLAVPFAVLGALVSLWIRGFSNDIYFQIGLLVLIGLSAKNAILIVEFAAQKMHEGLSPFDAAIEAAGLRLRPILMTSLAFVMGIVPLVFATGAGAGARHSMGTGVFGGMIAATFIATIFVPVFFTWFVKRKKAPETVSHMENEPKKPLF